MPPGTCRWACASIPRTRSMQAYDFTSERGLARTLDAVENTVGIDRVYVLHVNDSTKTPLRFARGPAYRTP